ncbi:hypothetical protein DVH05_004483 [Phytophthora capsici]|nr:hypothetical protein DVH05_004483 [Phytophthora capsici]
MSKSAARKVHELLVEWLVKDNHYARIRGKDTREEAVGQFLKVIADEELVRSPRTILDKVRCFENQNKNAVAFLRKKGYSIDDVLVGNVPEAVMGVRKLFPDYEYLMAIFQGISLESRQGSHAVPDEQATVRHVGAKTKRNSEIQQTSSKRRVTTNIVSCTRIDEISGWTQGPQRIEMTFKDLPERYLKKMRENVVKLQQQGNDGILQYQRETQQVAMQVYKVKARLELQRDGVSKEDAERLIPEEAL